MPLPTRPPRNAKQLPSPRVGDRRRHYDGSELVETEDDRDDAYNRGGMWGGEYNPFKLMVERRLDMSERYSPRGEWWVGPENQMQIDEDNAYRAWKAGNGDDNDDNDDENNDRVRRDDD